MKDSDLQRIRYMNKHYKELQDEMSMIRSFDEFVDQKNLIIKKAIMIDVAQISENIFGFSEELKSQIDTNDLKGIKDVRNFVIHGYAVVDDEILYRSIINDIPRLISSINSLMLKK